MSQLKQLNQQNSMEGGHLDYVGSLGIELIRGDGSNRNIGEVSSPKTYRLTGRPIQWWRALWTSMRENKIIASSLGFAAFLATYGVVDRPEMMHQLFSDPRVVSLIMGLGTAVGGLVVTGGMNYLASDFSAGLTTPRISGMNFHDSGTGNTAATSTDSGLQTQAGPATRATGVQSNPATNSYKSIGTIAYVSGLAIVEWGLFSAATSGTMWDRRVFSAVNVISGDSISFSYTLTLTAGGT